MAQISPMVSGKLKNVVHRAPSHNSKGYQISGRQGADLGGLTQGIGRVHGVGKGKPHTW